MSNAQGLESHIRPMARSDLPMVLVWRNHIGVRSYMYSQHEISAEEHASWYDKSIRNANHHLLIFEVDNEPMGFVKFIKNEDRLGADWGFYAAPNAPIGMGRKLGHTALSYGFGKLKFQEVCGQALIHNDRSIKMHLALGFKQKNLQAEPYFDGKNHHQVFAFSMLSQDWMQSNSN